LNQLERLLEAWRAECDAEPYPDLDLVYLRYIAGGGGSMARGKAKGGPGKKDRRKKKNR
jgi:hypothetical protein